MVVTDDINPAISKLNLSDLGFGAAPIGNLYEEVSDDEAQSAIIAALDRGINYFDTAPYYGFGLSERRLGDTLKLHPAGAEVTLSTKVGRCLRPIEKADNSLRYGFASAEKQEPYFDYSYSGVMRSFESSLHRLGVERLNILFAHDLGALTHGNTNEHTIKKFLEGGYIAMEELKRSGCVDAIGLGVNDCQTCVDLLNQIDLDCLLLAGRYTLLDQSAAREVFPLCAKTNTAIILGGPFNSGILAAGVLNKDSNQYYNYEPAPTKIVQRVKKIEELCADFSLSLAATALQFCCAHKQVTSVLAGLADKNQVEQSMDLLLEPIPAEFWVELKERGLLADWVTLPNKDV